MIKIARLYTLCILLGITLINPQLGNTATTQDFSCEFSIAKKWEATSFSMPESVLVIPGHNWLYVSNVNGEENDGYISKISRDGEIIEMKWVDGIHTPTGMGYHDGRIYVADQTQVHVISVNTGDILRTLSSEAKTLNDISLTPDGRVFVSDLSTGSIYTVQGDQVIPWFQPANIATLNGLLVQDNTLYAGSVGTVLSRNLEPKQYGSLYKINLSTKSFKMLPSAEKIGPIDGVVKFHDGIVISDPFNGKLYYLTEKDRILVKDNIEGGIADIGIDSETGMIYAPMIFGNSVIAFQLRKNNRGISE